MFVLTFYVGQSIITVYNANNAIKQNPTAQGEGAPPDSSRKRTTPFRQPIPQPAEEQDSQKDTVEQTKP